MCHQFNSDRRHERGRIPQTGSGLYVFCEREEAETEQRAVRNLRFRPRRRRKANGLRHFRHFIRAGVPRCPSLALRRRSATLRDLRARRPSLYHRVRGYPRPPHSPALRGQARGERYWLRLRHRQYRAKNSRFSAARRGIMASRAYRGRQRGRKGSFTHSPRAERAKSLPNPDRAAFLKKRGAARSGRRACFAEY